MTAPTARAAKRDLVAQIIADQLPSLGGRVFKGRVWPAQTSDLPAVLVYGWQETKTRKTLDAWTHQFEVSCLMAIQGLVQATSGEDLETAMEQLAGDIEAAILTSPLLLGLTGTLERIDRVETKMEASKTDGKEYLAEMLQGSVSMGFEMVWTEVQQITVPVGEQTDNFAIKSYPTIF